MRVALAPNGKVAIVVFLDPQGPFDARLYSTLKQVADLYPLNVSIDYEYFPLPMHRNAELAAEALIAARAQGKGPAMMDLVFTHQTALQRPDLDQYASQAGLNLDRFKSAMDSGAGKAAIESSLTSGRRRGVVGTPVIVLDDRKLVGNQTLFDLRTLIDADLKAQATEAERRTTAARQPADEKVELAFDDTWTAVYPCSTTDHFSALLKITRQGQQIRAVIQRTSGRNDPATLAAGMVAWQGQLPRASVTTDDLPLTFPVVSTYPKFSSTGIGLKGRYRRNNVATIVSLDRIEISGDEYPTTRGNTIEDAQKVIDQLAMDMLDRLEKLEAEKQEQKVSGAKRPTKPR